MLLQALCIVSKPLVNSNLSYSPEPPIRVKIGHFVSRGTLKFDKQSKKKKKIVHIFYAASSFVHHFIAISEFKLELQSGNAQFGSNQRFF